MSIIRQSLILAALGALSACAQTPAFVPMEKIVATPINHQPYMGFSCAKLVEDQARIARELEAAAQQKEKARDDPANDKTGPVIARLKGEDEAEKSAILSKKCSQAPQTKPTNS